MNTDPAFPTVKSEQFESEYALSRVWSEGGLTKREYFAGLAMQGLLAHTCDESMPKDLNERDIALRAVKCSDALLAELAKEKQDE